MNEISIKQIARGEKWQLIRGIAWRGLIVVIGTNLAGIFLANMIGNMIGVYLAEKGQMPSPDLVTGLSVLGLVLSVMIGVAFFYLYVRWLLAAKLGQFRMVLVRNDAAAPAAAS